MLNYYMGTGKTLISVALYLVYRRLAYERGLDVTPAFVVVPPTLVIQWIKEIIKHTYLTEHAICKYKEKSRDLSQSDNKYFIITSFNLVGSELSKEPISKVRSNKVTKFAIQSY